MTDHYVPYVVGDLVQIQIPGEAPKPGMVVGFCRDVTCVRVRYGPSMRSEAAHHLDFITRLTKPADG